MLSPSLLLFRAKGGANYQDDGKEQRKLVVLRDISDKKKAPLKKAAPLLTL